MPSHILFIINSNSENCTKIRSFFTKLQTKNKLAPFLWLTVKFKLSFDFTRKRIYKIQYRPVDMAKLLNGCLYPLYFPISDISELVIPACALEWDTGYS